jgi:hypothetical protein
VHSQALEKGERLLEVVFGARQFKNHHPFTLGKDLRPENIDLHLMILDKMVNNRLVAGLFWKSKKIDSRIHR